ncbi:NiFe-hydrogenase nickel incorporation protein HypB [Vibrio halioticoli NBRC 102217]|uniref:Hydrogenase maturation factor HypB n=1 Tax=Vibrio halioticoli NBRC 102217 TaxID=1219072 RepID=V5F373_9VIBR|nr:hydrogenase nickel incorporation protein HypB [Vibrio halioticoli]GAD89609.1 NiFe-hydrogenase nickel incorporation protein HypB [Vibrio halioticoli NBRC 102217]
MCTVCGCGTEQIEGHQHDHHSHSHDHNHDHAHPHDHNHGHSHNNDSGAQPVSVVHHHYHNSGDVHLHIYHAPNAVGSEQITPNSNASQPTHSHAHEHHNAPVHHSHEHHSHQNAEHHHHHEHEHEHSHEHTPHHAGHTLDYGVGDAHLHVPGLSQQRIIEIEQDILGKNNHIAAHNRSHFTADNLTVLNLVSSPGSGKTTLLTETIKQMQHAHNIAVIEGDQQTANDAERIRATGVQAIQVNTGKGCHLDASMIDKAYHQLQLANDSILFIENVGNLVCPADFDLGEQAKVAILSVTEGEEKPLKYPNMFAAANVMIINKTDLLPYVNFDLAQCIENARKVNPEIEVICLSATTGEGMERWINWILGDK